MANKNRSIYSVDEDILKRVVAGDTSALGEMEEQDSVPVGEKAPEAVAPGKREKASSSPQKPNEEKIRTEHEMYRKRFLSERLTGTRRQTYIHDSLYRVLSGALPVIAPDMSVPTFVNNVLSDHLEQYEEVINSIYNEEAIKKPVQWKK